MVKYYTNRTGYDIVKVDIENDLVQSIDRNANVDHVYFICCKNCFNQMFFT